MSGHIFFRRAMRPSRYGLFARLRRTHNRYEVWQDDGPPLVMTLRELDDLLDARRFPADFWASIHSADDTFKTGDHTSWIESQTGRRVQAPPGGAG